MPPGAQVKSLLDAKRASQLSEAKEKVQPIVVAGATRNLQVRGGTAVCEDFRYTSLGPQESSAAPTVHSTSHTTTWKPLTGKKHSARESRTAVCVGGWRRWASYGLMMLAPAELSWWKRKL
jgi:hypothetical protein